ncbi:MAG: hypothetical protein FJZ87_13345 [Chloroflexi bacterium]|nr:hypothetical protein [Chloroflexota bacterium]
MVKENFLWSAIKTGLVGGAIALFLCLIGMIEIFDKRDVIEGVITLGMFLLLATSFVIGFLSAQRTSRIFESPKPFHQLIAGLLASAVTGLVLALFVLAGAQINIRAVFLNASPGLYELLTFGRGLGGIWMLPLLGGAYTSHNFHDFYGFVLWSVPCGHDQPGRDDRGAGEVSVWSDRNDD